MYFKRSIRALSIVLNKGLFFVWVSLSNVLNSINTPKLLGSRHFKLQTISLPMISKDKPQLAYVFKILYPSNKQEKKDKLFSLKQFPNSRTDVVDGGQQMMGPEQLWLGFLCLPLNKVSTRIWETGDRVSICYRTSRKRDFEIDTGFEERTVRRETQPQFLNNKRSSS